MVTTAQRFHSKKNPCPACGGGDDLALHSGARCWGFQHDDPRYFTCTRVESPRGDEYGGYGHFRGRRCDCGARHDAPVGAASVRPQRLACDSEGRDGDDDRGGDRVAEAHSIWESARPIIGTPAERYLRTRGIIGPLPESLRYALLFHGPSRRELPALIAAVTTIDAIVCAVSRTYLRPDGSGKADVDPPRMFRGGVGGCAVHLAEPGPILAVAEGIETGLSVQQATGIPTWTALSAPGMTRLELPPLPLAREVVVAADADITGIEAATKARRRWRREGRAVRIACPPDGLDFNDLLLRGLAK